ncbi:hypothetical protein GCM10008957_36980 [Deinococcus ruber]|uniref:Uncharacterized protein n=1 Tax=Deinococcus ruber TaxID=1848197 RepID=A0A918CEM5_9DEIO|nr:hypothetical protein GCM10008957_36980 [Deinococcus ruber]
MLSGYEQARLRCKSLRSIVAEPSLLLSVNRHTDLDVRVSGADTFKEGVLETHDQAVDGLKASFLAFEKRAPTVL